MEADVVRLAEVGRIGIRISSRMTPLAKLAFSIKPFVNVEGGGGAILHMLQAYKNN